MAAAAHQAEPAERVAGVGDPDVEQAVVEPSRQVGAMPSGLVAAVADEGHPQVLALAVDVDLERFAVPQHPGQRHHQRRPLADAALQLLAGVDDLDVAPEAGRVEEGPAGDAADVDLDGVAGLDRLDGVLDRLDAQVAGQVVEGAGGDDDEGQPVLQRRRPPC